MRSKEQCLNGVRKPVPRTPLGRLWLFIGQSWGLRPPQQQGQLGVNPSALRHPKQKLRSVSRERDIGTEGLRR